MFLKYFKGDVEEQLNSLTVNINKVNNQTISLLGNFTLIYIGDD